MGDIWRCAQGHLYDRAFYGCATQGHDPCPACARERRDNAIRADAERRGQGSASSIQEARRFQECDERKSAALQAQVAALTAERDALRQAAMRLLTEYVAAQTEDGAADPLGCFLKTQASEEALEDLIPGDVWAAFHAERGGGQ